MKIAGMYSFSNGEVIKERYNKELEEI